MIKVDHYKQLKWTRGRETPIEPFTFNQLWPTDQPSLEIGSQKHGDLCITFQEDGSIELKYWSPKIPIDAEKVVPATIILK